MLLVLDLSKTLIIHSSFGKAKKEKQERNVEKF